MKKYLFTDGDILVGFDHHDEQMEYVLVESYMELEDVLVSKERLRDLKALAAAVEGYTQYLPKSKPIGANRHSGMVVAAHKLRNALAALAETE